MNDRYLCRAKRKNFRELQKEKWWVTGYLVNKKCGKYSTVGFEEFEKMIIVTNFSDGGIDWCYIDEDTICQCTGLKKFYEKDIVKRIDIHKAGDPSIGIIEYDVENTAFVIHWIDKQKYSPMYPWKDKIEVIGNIFDTPELLEVGE